MHRVFSVCFLIVFYFFSSRPAGRNFGANSNAAQKSPRRNFGANANAGGLLIAVCGYLCEAVVPSYVHLSDQVND